MKYTWSDAIIDTLLHYGIDTIFWYPWWANIPFFDSLVNHPEMTNYLNRHEQASAFAAQWVSRSSNNIWVCVTTSWPWASNAITWVMDAFMDGIPMLFISWQVPYNLVWNDVFQELDATWVTLSITKSNFLVSKVEDIVPTIHKALEIALSWRPWPVHVDVPKNILAADHPENFEIPDLKIKKDYFYDWKFDKYEEILYRLRNSQKPVLLLWQWVKQAWAEKEINELIKKLNIPVVSSLLWKWLVTTDNYLWMIGMHWHYHANMAIFNSDFILNIWSRFDDRLVWTYDTFWKNSVIVHVDIDKTQLWKYLKTDYKVNMDAKLFLSNFMEYELSQLNIDKWRSQIEEWNNQHPYVYDTEEFTVQTVYGLINNSTAKDLDNFIFVTDVWQHQMWASQMINVSTPKSWLSSWWAGTMWFALPTAIWAAIANPDKVVVVLAWDWWIQMNIQEFQTIRHYNLNIKTFILNNWFLWMVRQWQDLFYNKNYSWTPISSPNFKIIWDAYDIESFSFDTIDGLFELIDEKLYSDWPVIIESKVLPECNIYPMVPPWKSLNETIIL